jgi:hypothetical protein
VEGARDRQLDRSPGTLALGLFAALVHRIGLPRDDDLARAIVIRRPDAVNLSAKLLHDLVLEPENRRHRAWALLGDFGHRQPALTHEPDRVSRVEHASCRQRRELSNRVADNIVRPEAERLDRRQNGQAGSQQRGLLNRCIDEIFDRARKAERRQVETAALASALVYRHRLGHSLGDLAAHPGLDRSLAGEAEGDLPFRSTLSSVSAHCLSLQTT